MKYPRYAPSTEATVQIVAITIQRARFASTIGISMMSGGIGKNELSAKETPASAQSA